ncbi:unnamed protein product [Staurois parvus]|uniref:Uncharacterized protein n=1 Tax=Staurois parvus TaxID=386267 RepID=A0ABN9GG77_9NEOB|nr:unnamed protein product [Staurois parvus]
MLLHMTEGTADILASARQSAARGNVALIPAFPK